MVLTTATAMVTVVVMIADTKEQPDPEDGKRVNDELPAPEEGGVASGGGGSDDEFLRFSRKFLKFGELIFISFYFISFDLTFFPFS